MYCQTRVVLERPRRLRRHDQGVAMVSALMFLLVLALLSTSIATVTTQSSQIGGNYKASVQALQG